jgi:hypothetical protein
MKIIFVALIMLICELTVAFIFAAIAQHFYKKSEIDFKSVVKGLIERLFLTLFMFNDLPHALTFFSALKLATRLKHDDSSGETERFNSYYLVGNLVSVSLALFYVFVWKHAGNIDEAIMRLSGR